MNVDDLWIWSLERVYSKLYTNHPLQITWINNDVFKSCRQSYLVLHSRRFAACIYLHFILRKSIFKHFSDDSILIMTWNKHCCVSFHLMILRNFLDTLLFQTYKLYYLLSLWSFCEYLLILNFLHIFFFFDAWVKISEK